MVNYLVPTKHTTAKVTMQNYGETFGHYSTLKPEERYNYHISSQNSIIELIANKEYTYPDQQWHDILPLIEQI